ncbi:MAG: domain containing protein [Firmicutes bacterium]|nr:domain containing protein [Bacillota bacterium]
MDLTGYQLNKNRKNDHANLIIINTGDLAIDKQTFSFDNMITIGRNSDNDIVIDDKYVSHYHAQIKNIKSNYLLEDLKSINNTYLNDEILLKEKVLNSGDIIKIGMVTFKFER